MTKSIIVRLTALWNSRHKQTLLTACGVGIILIFSLILAAIRSGSSHQLEKSGTNDQTRESVDTFIPSGYVLVPIEVINYEALDSILGKYGVVDLFVPGADPDSKPVRVAERIKILRAPLNPKHFAVLAPESESSRLVRQESAFHVVIQNPKSSGTTFVKEPRQKPFSRIVVEESR